MIFLLFIQIKRYLKAAFNASAFVPYSPFGGIFIFYLNEKIFKGSLNQNKLFTRKSQNKNKASYYVSLLTGENFFVSQVTWGPIFKFYFKVGFGVQGLLLE